MQIHINRQFMIFGVLLCFILISACGYWDKFILDCSSNNRTNQQLVVNLMNQTIVRLIGTVELYYKIKSDDEYTIFASGKVSIIEKWEYLAKNIKKDISKLWVSIEINRVNGKTLYSLHDKPSDGTSGPPKGL